MNPAKGINVFLGNNGSGKTSLLEAIYILSIGRSCRTRSLKNVIQFGQSHFQIVAKSEHAIPIGIRYEKANSQLIARLNSEPVKRLSELAYQLPLQYIPANCHQIFEQGPAYRRQLLDWGLFHVEPQFNFYAQSYKKLIQQRNAAIKAKQSDEEITLWDRHYCDYGERIAELRSKQLDSLCASFHEIFTEICPEYIDAEIAYKYKKGWIKDDLADSLQQGLGRDKKLQYSKEGPHAADWLFVINDIHPAELLSRGQQKLYFIALALSQAKLVNMQNKSQSIMPILLIDDLSSELDIVHQELVMHVLSKQELQCFISTTDTRVASLRESEKMKVFHVEQGNVTQ
jgi:DNA replication and repair protein RecF